MKDKENEVLAKKEKVLKKLKKEGGLVGVSLLTNFEETCVVFEKADSFKEYQGKITPRFQEFLNSTGITNKDIQVYKFGYHRDARNHYLTMPVNLSNSSGCCVFKVLKGKL